MICICVYTQTQIHSVRREQRVSGRLRQWWPLGAAQAGRGRGHQSGIQLHPNSVIVLWGHVTGHVPVPAPCPVPRPVPCPDPSVSFFTKSGTCMRQCSMPSPEPVPCHFILYLSLPCCQVPPCNSKTLAYPDAPVTCHQYYADFQM